jgi:acyl-CoA thioester hydrolase
MAQVRNAYADFQCVMTTALEGLIASRPVTVRQRVRWGDCDPAGVVYTPRFSEYVIYAAGFFYEEVVPGGLPLKALSFTFSHFLKPRDVFITTVALGEVRSRTFDLLIKGALEDGTPVFSAQCTPICVNSTTRTAEALPQSLRDALEAYRRECAAN